jgi:hypothetical protein
MTRTALVGVAALAAALTACGGDGVEPGVVPPAVGGRRDRINPDYVDFELPGPNLWFLCHGSVGVYVTEGDNDDSGKSAAPSAVLNHPACKEGAP